MARVSVREAVSGYAVSLEMTKRVAALVGILWLAMPACARAQAVIEADAAMLQPLISRDESGFKGCGIRVLLSVSRQWPKADFYDFSINFYSSSLAVTGVVKIGKQVGDLQTKKRYSEVPGPISFWFASEQSGKAIKAKRLRSSTTKGFKLGVVDAIPGFEAMMEIAEGKRMHIAAHYAKED